MVDQQEYHIFKSVPGAPPHTFDESWWEAILTQEEFKSSPKFFQYYPLLVEGEFECDLEKEVSSASIQSPLDPTEINLKKAKYVFERDQVVTLHVFGYNQGGLLVNGCELQGFVPISHLVDVPANIREAEQETCLSTYAGKVLNLKIIEFDGARYRIIFSERAAMAEPGSRPAILKQLEPGKCVDGCVTTITDFGIFIDLGGVEGLAHVSEISWGRVNHPSEIVHLGQHVRAFVISVDQDRSRVALSLKRLCPNPWDNVEQRYSRGQIVDVTIISIVAFGAFARLEQGLDGLIHVSEIRKYFGLETPFVIGQQIRVRILHINSAKQRMGLSLMLNPTIA